MRRIAQNIVLALLAVAIVVAGLWTWSRLREPSPEQQRALALLQQPPAPPGRNAFAALWLLQYDVPESQLQDIADADAARAARLLAARGGDGTAPMLSFRSGAEGRYTDLSPSTADAALFCKVREDDCLARVRSDPDAYAALIARNRKLLDRVAGLSGYDFYRYGMPRDFLAPPPSQLIESEITRLAHRFASGDSDAALAGTCGGILTWRRLGANSDTLVMRMVGATYATDGYARLFAEMLAELPNDHPLPGVCERAFAAPEIAELSICAQMRGEFLQVSDAMRDLRKDLATRQWVERTMTPLAFDANMTLATSAPTYAHSCTREARAALAEDARMPSSPEAARSLWRLECAANVTGCILARISAPAYHEYPVRMQDYGARLDLMATLLRLRAQAGDADSLQTALARQWARARSAGREVRIGDDGTTLAVRQRWTGRGEWWQVPLPASAIVAAVRE